MFSLDKVTTGKSGSFFCLTDCGPSEGCNPDDFCAPDDDDDKLLSAEQFQYNLCS